MCVQPFGSAHMCEKVSNWLLSSSSTLWFWSPPPQLPSASQYTLSFQLTEMMSADPDDTRPIAGIALSGSYDQMELYCDGE